MGEATLFSVDIRRGRGTLVAPHYHEGSMEFLRVVKGVVDVTVGLDSFRLTAGQILHHVPGRVHYAISVGEEESLIQILDYSLSLLSVTDALDERFLSLYRLEKRTELFDVLDPLHETLSAHMDVAVSEWQGKEILYSAVILSEIAHMQAALVRAYSYRDEDTAEYRNMMRVAPILSYIDASYADKLRLEDLAAKLYLSPDHFGKLFRSTVGMTPVDYVNYTRIGAAMRYLSESDLGIAEIARLAGFSNPNYFHKVFHDLTGKGPAALRKQWRAMQSDYSLT